MKTTKRSGSGPAVEPVVDVSLLALLDDDAVSAVTSTVAATAPGLMPDLRRLTATHPGLHVTLYEFLHVPGHEALPLARQWCQRSGADMVERAAGVGPVTFRATTLRLSPVSAVVALTRGRPSTWARDVIEVCSAFDTPVRLRGRGPPEPLHMTIARHPTMPSDMASGNQESPLRFDIRVDQFCLALALQLPYGRIHCLHPQGARQRWTPH
jgi:hypothetical protein